MMSDYERIVELLAEIIKTKIDNKGADNNA
jgi:hypothetical protein